MRIDILTIFPEIVEEPLRASLLGKAIREGILDAHVWDIREFATDKHRTVDDAPFGGGPGMVMKCEPIFGAVESLHGQNSCERVVLLSPRGRTLTQEIVRELAEAPDLVLLCGRYEGVDERVSEALVTDEISIGDYVLSGGEIPALVLIDAISRMLPGVVGDPESVSTDSFYEGILGPPQYTRPAEFRGMKVPQTLLDGNHAAIARLRRKESLRVTKARRPDLLNDCSDTDRAILVELEREVAERPCAEETQESES